jgi:hypothetical protein
MIGPKKICVFPVACLKIIGSVGRLSFFCVSNPIVTIVRLTMALSAVKKLELVPEKWGRSGNRKHTFFFAYIGLE